MNEFMSFIIPLIAMLLFTSQTSSFENNDPLTSELRRALFGAVKTSKRTSKYDDVKFFEGIREGSFTTTTDKSLASLKHKIQNSSADGDKNFDELKVLLAKLLDKIGNMEKDSKRDADKDNMFSPMVSSSTVSPEVTRADLTEIASTSSASAFSNFGRKRKAKDRAKKDKKQRWGKWTNWSPCSVSCGKGREIRWRHCLENCEIAETEMEEKTCQLPACGPSKLFGVIKL